MNLMINLSPESVNILRQQAAYVGQWPEEFVKHLVDTRLAIRSLEQDLVRFREAVIASGETEEEWGHFFKPLLTKFKAIKNDIKVGVRDDRRSHADHIRYLGRALVCRTPRADVFKLAGGPEQFLACVHFSMQSMSFPTC